MLTENQSNAADDDRRLGKPSATSKLMTLAEVANLLRRTDEAVRRLLRVDPCFPQPIRVGAGGKTRKRVLFSRSEIEDWLQTKFDARDGRPNLIGGIHEER
jgi:predicted DNA-binding transcriptional regulator AlpA